MLSRSYFPTIPRSSLQHPSSTPFLHTLPPHPPRYKPEKLMEHLKLFSSRLNIPRLIRACDEQQLWKELTYLYMMVGPSGGKREQSGRG